MADASALQAFALRVLAIFAVLALVTSALGLALKARPPGFDLATLQAVAANRNQLVASIASVVTYAGSLFLLIPLLAGFLLLRRWHHPSDDLTLIVVAAGSAALAALVKLVVERPRPAIGALSHPESSSFPSEHAVQAAAIYLTAAIVVSEDLSPTMRGLLIGIAIVIALIVAGSRIYLGVHFPTDVAAGLVLGWSWALLVWRLARPTLP